MPGKKTLSKQELAKRCNISRGNLSNMLNHRYFIQLQAVGYEKKSRLLTKAQLDVFCLIYEGEKYDGN